MDNYRLIGFRYATDSKNKSIKSLQFLGIHSKNQEIACNTHAHKMYFVFWVPLVCLIELIIVAALIVKFVICARKAED